MTLRFERGDPEHPRGHAIVYFRDAADATRTLATYLVILPIVMDVAKYLPPLLAGRLPFGEAKAAGALPLPPVPELVESREALDALAEARFDDVLFAGSLAAGDFATMIQAVAEAAMEYHERYEAARQRLTTAARATPAASEDAPGELDVRDAVWGLMGETDRVAELARLTGPLRYAVLGRDEPLIAQAVADLERLGKHLHPKYRFDSFLAAARTYGPKGDRLSDLYVQRCYSICHHKFDALETLDAEIAALEAGQEATGA